MTSPSSSLASLLCVARELFCKGKREEALDIFEAALEVRRNPIKPANADKVSKKLQWGDEKLQDTKESDSPVAYPHNLPDTYHEDECDVGPRPYRLPLFPEHLLGSEDPHELAYFDSIMMYNRALHYHLSSDFTEGMKLYETLALSVANALQQQEERNNDCSNTNSLVYEKLLELMMRVNNNMACIAYTLRLEDVALRNFESALLFANRYFSLQETHQNKDLQLDYAALLSNWCRVHWMTGDITEDVHQGLQDVLRIRSSILGWNHMDTAAAHFNLGVSEYARNKPDAAMDHLFSYLQVAAQEAKTDKKKKVLDPIPALIYILLVKNEHKEDEMSQELVRGLRSLQEKRADVGPRGAEVASVLNYTGTLLFHQHDYEHALLFFQEELRLEENLVLNEDDVSVSVTCNNIGRILQELNRLPEAKTYYYRALKSHYGDDIEDWCSQPKGSDSCPLELTKKKTENLPHTTMQLYSAVWYNLGT